MVLKHGLRGKHGPIVLLFLVEGACTWLLDSGRACGSLEARVGVGGIPVPQRLGRLRQAASAALLECSAQGCTYTRVQTHAHTCACTLTRPHTHIKSSSGHGCPCSTGAADRRALRSLQRSSGSISLVCSWAHLCCRREHLSRTPNSLRLSDPHTPGTNCLWKLQACGTLRGSSWRPSLGERSGGRG